MSKHLSFVCKEILSILDKFEGEIDEKTYPIHLVIYIFMAHFENSDLCKIHTEHHSQLVHLAKEMLKSPDTHKIRILNQIVQDLFF